LHNQTDQFLDGFYGLVEARAAEIAAGEFAAAPVTRGPGAVSSGFEMRDAAGHNSRGVSCSVPDPLARAGGGFFVRSQTTEKVWQL
jgi:hypothetical protein